jgi:hypothetical protein
MKFDGAGATGVCGFCSSASNERSVASAPAAAAAELLKNPRRVIIASAFARSPARLPSKVSTRL